MILSIKKEPFMSKRTNWDRKPQEHSIFLQSKTRMQRFFRKAASQTQAYICMYCILQLGPINKMSVRYILKTTEHYTSLTGFSALTEDIVWKWEWAVLKAARIFLKRDSEICYVKPWFHWPLSGNTVGCANPWNPNIHNSCKW